MYCCWPCPSSKTKSLELAQSLESERQNILDYNEQPIDRHSSDHQEKMLVVTDRALSYIEQNRHELQNLHKSVQQEANRDIAEILSLSQENLNFTRAIEDVRPRSRHINELKTSFQLDSSLGADCIRRESPSAASAGQCSGSNLCERTEPKDAPLETSATVK